MTAGISHEIRNPLNAAVLQLNLLSNDIERLATDLRASMRSSARAARDEMGRVAHLLEDFSSMATPSSPALRSVDLGTLAERVLDFIAPDAQLRSIRIVRTITAGHLAMIDEQQVRQVVTNICLNAIEATPAIEIAVSSDQQGV